ncbi:MAG: carbohydrate porin [Candidatus Omnitrophica bacterium]|nr:carbohydrate porin [Candidatus Omnitrophota bacterium]MDD5237641.1 carbohydrate porin [Candidatus Omnitrophota bacterium]
MAVLKKAALFLVVFSFLCSTEVFADDVSIRGEINQLKERIAALEKKASDQDKYIATQNSTVQTQQQTISEYETKLSQFEEKLKRVPGEPIQLMEGLELGAGATMIVQGTNNVNYTPEGETKKKNRTDGAFSADITLAKEFKEFNSRAFLHLESGQGQGLEDNLMLYSNVNRDADDEDDMRITELWYEQGLFEDRVALTFGKLDPTAYFDQNDVANDETTQFLGRIFRNIPTLEFPDNNAGIRVAYMPKEWLELGYGMFNAKSSWEKIGDSLFNIGQVHFKTNFLNLPGNYRFYGWNNNANHTKWSDTEKGKESAYGFGLSFDQKLTNVVTAFCRYGWQNPEVYNPDPVVPVADESPYSLEQSWSVGLQVEGKPWGREKDVLAFAIGQALPSGDYKKYYGYTAKPEGHLEAYYRIFVNKYLSLSPDFQYIWNPFGNDVGDDPNSIFVGGMRAQVDF